MNSPNFFAELKRRNLYKGAVVTNDKTDHSEVFVTVRFRAGPRPREMSQHRYSGSFNFRSNAL